MSDTVSISNISKEDLSALEIKLKNSADQSYFWYLLRMADHSMILGHRLSELCGHGPNLETDIAITNIALDLWGEARSYFALASTLCENISEDQLAFLRAEDQYRHSPLLSWPNEDFAFVIVRQYLFDEFQMRFLEKLSQSENSDLAALAEKSIKEARYHLRFSTDWLRQLALGTEESAQRIQKAWSQLWPLHKDLFWTNESEQEMMENDWIPNRAELYNSYISAISLNAVEFGLEGDFGAELQFPAEPDHKEPFASDSNLAEILLEIQYMQRRFPNLNW
jgi:ring-1,2-phenylacetyl-CoA epoxidase subunit PaaC